MTSIFSCARVNPSQRESQVERKTQDGSEGGCGHKNASNFLRTSSHSHNPSQKQAILLIMATRTQFEKSSEIGVFAKLTNRSRTASSVLKPEGLTAQQLLPRLTRRKHKFLFCIWGWTSRCYSCRAYYHRWYTDSWTTHCREPTRSPRTCHHYRPRTPTPA